MQTFVGIGVSPGVAIGEAFLLDHEGFRIPRRFVTRGTRERELARLRDAFAAAAAEIADHREHVQRELGAPYAAIFSAHQQMLEDSQLRGEIESLVTGRDYSPEYAVSRSLRRYVKILQNLNSSFLAQRATDVCDVEKRLLRHLLGRHREALTTLTSPVIVLAHDLTPSETAGLDRAHVLGLVSEVGGAGGHTSIIAEALQIPAVVGTGRLLTEISGGDTLIVDGDRGQVILQPDADTLAQYRQQHEQHRSLATQLQRLRDLPAITKDHQQINLYANLEFPSEIETCQACGAEGIGLYRTEFLYLGADREPREEDHFQAYARVVQSMGGCSVVIRTLDLGADKMGSDRGAAAEERNPFLGLRSIRLSLKHLAGFRTQLRAILRASALGPTRIMFPLISTIGELRQAKALLADTMEDLEEAQIPFDRQLPVGMMVEVPAAVVLLDRFLQEVDFISIGTNDLIQYALAVDRSNRDVAPLYTASDPAVLRLIDLTLQAARRHQKDVAMCGQMSGGPIYTMLLIGMGLRTFSVTPSAIPEIKSVCRSVTVSQCQQVAERALGMDSALEITDYLREELRKVASHLLPNPT